MMKRYKFPVTKVFSVIAILLSVGVCKVEGQRIYATQQRSGSSNVVYASVNNASFVKDIDYTNYATLTANSVVGVSSSWSQPIFPSNLMANDIVYLRFGNISTALLGGELTGTAYVSAVESGAGAQDGSSVSSSASVVTAVDNTTYLKIIPTNSFNSVRATLKSPIALGSNIGYIYYAFYIPAPTINGATICSGASAELTVSNPIANFQYNWYASASSTEIINSGISFKTELFTTTTYYVEAVETAPFVSRRTPVTVTVNPLPTITVSQSAQIINTAGSVTLNATHNGTSVKWYDQNGNYIASNASTTLGPFATAGTYIFTAVSSNATCSNSASVTVSVYSSTECPPLTERVFANSQSWTTVVSGTLDNPGNAVDGNTRTFSRLSSGIGLLGLGTVKQDLKWSTTVPKGTPVTIKMGNGSSVIALATGISLIGLKKIGNTYVEIGTLQSVNASLLNLLPGENVFEYSFVPSDGSGPQSYDGVRIVLASLVSLGQTMTVYDAYYNKSTNTIDCSKGDVRDVFYGAVDLGVGALTATVGVANPLNAVDGIDGTYAEMFNNVGVLAYAKLQTLFASPSLSTDSLKIITSTGSSLLNVNLLTGFSIQRYLGGTTVGLPMSSSSTFLSVQLLAGGTLAAINLAPMPEPYDRIEIKLGGAVGVLASLRIHEIQRIANTKLISSDLNNQIEVCQGIAVKLQAPSDACTTFKWYDSITGGNEITSGLTLNTTGLTGSRMYYIQPIRQGCEIIKRGIVKVTIFPLPPHPTMQVNSH